ncbi:hypothetical protein OAZ21_02445, partial [Bacteroidota bacterium]|nr:hypothetical protein [Bacteroidota bacterium]
MFLLLDNSYYLHSQTINSADGLRLAGSFRNSMWTNNYGQLPPMGMTIRTDNPTTAVFWKTGAFQETVAFASSYTFKFASGNANPWANEWGTGILTLDNVGNLDHPASNASISITHDGAYMAIWQDVGYQPTKASFLYLGSNPSNVSLINESSTPSVSGSTVNFYVNSPNNAIDPALTNEQIYAVYYTQGTTTVVGCVLLSPDFHDHQGTETSVSDGTYNCLYVVSTANAINNFMATNKSLETLMFYNTFLTTGTSFTVSSSCSEYTSGGSITGAQNNCGSFDPTVISSSSSPSGGSGGSTTYQWQKSTTNSSSGFSDISSSNSSTYNPGTITQTTWYRRGAYRCGSGGIQYTTALEMTVNAVPSSVSVGGGGNTCGTLTLLASGGSGGTIYWQNTSSSGTSTSTASIEQDISATGTYYFRSRSSAGCWGTEGSASVTKNTSATISSQPGSLGTYSSNGSGTSNSVSATISNGSSPTYQWKYSSSSGGSYSAVSNGTPSGATYTNGTSASNFQVDGIDAAGTYYYKLYVTDTDDECSDPTSNEISLSVTCTEVTTGGSISGAQSSCGSFNPTSITSSSDPDGSGGTLTYKWQKSTTDASSGFSDIASSNSSTYDPGTITQTTWYRRGAYRCNS